MEVLKTINKEWYMLLTEDIKNIPDKTEREVVAKFNLAHEFCSQVEGEDSIKERGLDEERI